MKTYIILSEKPWHKILFKNLAAELNEFKWELISKKEKFNLDILESIKPDKIFIPHWSYIIPSSIFENYECIVFHMTDLPYGRGGSPLQNLIVRGQNKTVISALKVEKGIDTGPVYLKKKLPLHGTAREIFIKSTPVIETMIKEIVINDLEPVVQTGKVTEFKRRTPEESNLEKLKDINKVYDFIRMLDCDGYPPAYFETEHFRLEFSRASIMSEKEIKADVRIIKK